MIIMIISLIYIYNVHMNIFIHIEYKQTYSTGYVQNNIHIHVDLIGWLKRMLGISRAHQIVWIRCMSLDMWEPVNLVESSWNWLWIIHVEGSMGVVVSWFQHVSGFQNWCEWIWPYRCSEPTAFGWSKYGISWELNPMPSKIFEEHVNMIKCHSLW